MSKRKFQNLEPETHLKTDDDRQCEVELLSGLDDTLSDDVASHDTTEDVNEDHVDFRVSCDDFEGFLDGVGSGTATDVQEVCGISSMELNDVHGGHGKTSSVDHASDGSIQSNVVQVELSGSDFLGVFLRKIALGEKLLLTELSVVVETHLSIKSEVCSGDKVKCDNQSCRDSIKKVQHKDK